MDLSTALTIASRYAKAKATTRPGLRSVHLTTGQLVTNNGEAGTLIKCPDVPIGVDAVVDCETLRKMVAAVGAGAKLEQVDGFLVVKGGGSSFKLQLLDAAEAPEKPAEPADGWKPVSDALAATLGALGALADTGAAAGAFHLGGVRLTPAWCGATSNEVGGAVWAGPLEEKVLVPNQVVRDLGSGCEVAADKTHLFVRDEGGLRWATQLAADWPDTLVDAQVPALRGQPARRTVTVDLADAITVLKQAEVVYEAAGASCRLKVAKAGITVEAHGSPKGAGAGNFSGAVSADVADGKGDLPDLEVGIGPAALRHALEAARDAGNEKASLSFASKVDALLVTAGPAGNVVECFVTPKHI